MAAHAPERLRVCLVTDGRGDLARIERVVDAVLAGGCRCVQLREFGWSARQLAEACERLRPRVEACDGWLLVNDRVDVAASGAAHGVQLGHRSLAPAAARARLGRAAVIGYSAHDAAQLATAAAAGCDFALLSPVWPTQSKPGALGLGWWRGGRPDRPRVAARGLARWGERRALRRDRRAARRAAARGGRGPQRADGGSRPGAGRGGAAPRLVRSAPQSAASHLVMTSVSEDFTVAPLGPAPILVTLLAGSPLARNSSQSLLPAANTQMRPSAMRVTKPGRARV
ncbi:MAG: thiamine phosphate synthase [Planctomycetes bacterium]|nr:thiamine phosphate synthase [Planctomycetota bacterium]